MTHTQRLERMQQYKVPLTKHKYVGIELEFSCPAPRDAIKELLIEANVDQYVSIGSDGGNWPGEYRHEIRILLKQYAMKEPLQKIGAIISSLGGRFHPGSGFHVHFDMRHRDEHRAFHNLVLCQDLLFKMTPVARAKSTWCKKVGTTTIEECMTSKSRAINPILSPTKKTIEIRIRESTTDWKDVYYWTMLGAFIIDKPKLRSYVSKLNEFVSDMNPPDFLVEYVKSKIKGVKS